MLFELDTAPPVDAPAPDTALIVVSVPDDTGTQALINQDDMKRFAAMRDTFVAKWEGFVVNSEEDVETVGRVVETCISMKKGIEGAFKKAVDYFFANHRALTAERGALGKPFEDLEKALRKMSTDYRVKKKEEDRQAAIKAQREAEEQAQAKAAAERAEAQAAADRAAAEARTAAEAAAALAETDDIDAIMAAEAAAGVAAGVAAAAIENAVAVREEPVYVPAVAVAMPTLSASAGGSTLVDNWVPEYEEDEAFAVRAIVAALPTRPDLIGLLSLNEAAVKAMAKALKGEARIPGVKVRNKPIDRRVSARGK